LTFSLLYSRAIYVILRQGFRKAVEDDDAHSSGTGNCSRASILFTSGLGRCVMSIHLAYLAIAFAAGAVLGSLIMIIQMSLMQIARENDDIYAEVRVHEYR
jgi:hypothetical protein